MNIIFLTVSRINKISDQGIYTDLMRYFRDNGHNVYIVSPMERQYKSNTNINNCDGVNILRVKTLNIQKTNVIEKGIGTILLEYQYVNAIKKHLKNIRFDLVLYSTPPVTLAKVINFVKKRDGALSYLMLKDIFPQNAVDIKMLNPNGIFYNFFRKKEKKMYQLSDKIGCMSPANIEYLLKQNQEISAKHVELCPNTVELKEKEQIDKIGIRKKYNIPTQSTVFIYGGNLGKPQGIPFLIKAIDSQKNKENCFFVIAGSGTEYNTIETWYKKNNPQNILLLKSLPKIDYDILVQSCDVGMIFLDNRFTIPNYPSRLLSYLQNSMPIITATDSNTDIGRIAEKNGYGIACLSGDLLAFDNAITIFVENPSLIKKMGDKALIFLKENYLTEHAFSAIIKHFS